MKMRFFACVRTVDPQGKTGYRRVRITLDIPKGTFSMYVLPGPSHRLCSHEPTQMDFGFFRGLTPEG
jgi:hypothetical protein